MIDKYKELEKIESQFKIIKIKLKSLVKKKKRFGLYLKENTAF